MAIGVTLINARRFSDDRGWFSETYNERAFLGNGFQVRFVQDNHSLSRLAGTLRGLHYQRPPHDQAKLVRCLRGRIFDVVIDIRAGSPSYGKWIGVELDAEEGRQLFVPSGFLHGFLTLSPDTEVIYKVSHFYAPESDAGIRWDDPTIGIKWPISEGSGPLLSSKDARLPLLAEIATPFSFGSGDVPLAKPAEISI